MLFSFSFFPRQLEVRWKFNTNVDNLFFIFQSTFAILPDKLLSYLVSRIRPFRVFLLRKYKREIFNVTRLFCIHNMQIFVNTVDIIIYLVQIMKFDLEIYPLERTLYLPFGS